MIACLSITIGDGLAQLDVGCPADHRILHVEAPVVDAERRVSRDVGRVLRLDVGEAGLRDVPGVTLSRLEGGEGRVQVLRDHEGDLVQVLTHVAGRGRVGVIAEQD